MNDDVFLFAKDRYFVDEAVEIIVNSQRLICRVFLAVTVLQIDCLLLIICV